MNYLGSVAMTLSSAAFLAEIIQVTGDNNRLEFEHSREHSINVFCQIIFLSMRFATLPFVNAIFLGPRKFEIIELAARCVPLVFSLSSKLIYGHFNRIDQSARGLGMIALARRVGELFFMIVCPKIGLVLVGMQIFELAWRASYSGRVCNIIDSLRRNRNAFFERIKGLIGLSISEDSFDLIAHSALRNVLPDWLAIDPVFERCPITHQLMSIVLRDATTGHAYDPFALEEWLSRDPGQRMPLTRQPVVDLTLGTSKQREELHEHLFFWSYIAKKLKIDLSDTPSAEKQQSLFKRIQKFLLEETPEVFESRFTEDFPIELQYFHFGSIYRYVLPPCALTGKPIRFPARLKGDFARSYEEKALRSAIEHGKFHGKTVADIEVDDKRAMQIQFRVERLIESYRNCHELILKAINGAIDLGPAAEICG